MRKLFEYYMFWVMLIILVLHFSSMYLPIGSWDLNRTIGWGWDISNFLWWSGIIQKIVFVIGYGIILFLNRKNKFYLSIIHIALILLVELFPFYNLPNLVLNLLDLSIWIIFIANLLTSSKRVV